MAPLHRGNVLALTATVAVAMPVAAFAWVDYQNDKLCDHIHRVAGVPAHIGSVDADLTGQIRLSEVTLGTQLSARAIFASIGARSMVTGDFGVDEIRVASPRVAIIVDRNGDTDLAVLLRRFGRAKSRPQKPPRLRRIAVDSGAFIARVAGIGEISATDVELVPNPTGVRMLTGPVHIRADVAGVRGELDLGRSAADIALPHGTIGRFLAVAGRGSAVAGGATIAVQDVVVGRLGSGPALELHATIDDAGIPRTISASVDTPGSASAQGLSLTLRGTDIPLRSLSPLVPQALGIANAHASGEAIVRWPPRGVGPQELQIVIDGNVDRAQLDHGSIAPLPITIGATVRGTLMWSADRVVAAPVEIAIGAARWNVSGHWSRRQPVSGQWDFALSPAPCNDLFQSLPVEIRGALDGLAMTGTLGGRVRLAVDLGAAAGEGVALTTEIANRCTVTAEATAADPATLLRPTDHVFADGSHARVGPGTPTWTGLHQLPAHVVAAFVSAEDARFYDHRGFDSIQIGKSLEIDLRDRQLTRGGSTITQQLVKNSFLTHRRSLDRKIQEAILTWRVEAKLRKAQILERYLNIIELAPHVFGIEAAAQHWFGKSAAQLGVRQAAFLAALTSEPTSMSRRLGLASGLDPESAARVDTVLSAMFRDGAIDRPTLDLARKAPLPLSPAALGKK